MKTGNCKLTALSLEDKDYKDAGVEYLGGALMYENCKLIHRKKIWSKQPI
mgnify:CR=1 FL=1